MDRFKTLLAPPIFADVEKTRVAGLLNVALLLLFGITFLLGLLIATTGSDDAGSMVLAWITAAAVLFLRWLMFQGHVRPAAYAFSLILICTISLDIYNGGTIRAPITTAYLVAIFAAGLLIGSRAAMLMTTLSIVILFGLLQLETAGRLTPTDAPVGLWQWITYTASFAASVGLMSMTVRSLNRALRQSRENERQLAQARDHLEEKVLARTADLAETNHQLELEIEERRRVEAVLRERTENLDQFAYVVSHDLKAPLRAITNLSQWIEEDMGANLPEDVAVHLTLMRQRVRRMQDLIEGILQYSRAGRRMSELEPVDVNALLDEVLEVLQPSPTFTIQIDPEMPTVTAERIKLGQVFTNLISNALKYHDRPDGRVQITVDYNNGSYHFAVADDGPGIDPQYHERIFQMFQTLHSRDEMESSGVGLAVARKIVEENGGHITVESEEGQGATFHFSWPVEGGA